MAVLDVLEAAFAGLGRDPADVADRIAAEAGRIGFDDRFLHRALNVDLSGGEKKRNETLQLGVLEPAIAVLDELDSGLDVDALRACARRIEAATEETGLGVLAITHYSRLLHELRADHVHVLVRGAIQRSRRPRAGRRARDHRLRASERRRAVAAEPRPVRRPLRRSRPDLARSGRGRLVEALLQRVPREGGALDAHRELHDALQRLEVAELHARRSIGRRSGSAPSPSSAGSWIDIIALNARVRARASSTVLPLTAADIIEADDWLIEQPWPPMRMSATVPSSTSR